VIPSRIVPMPARRFQVLASSLACLALTLASLPAAAGPVSLGVAGFALAAPEDDTAAAREAYNEGEKAYRLGKFEDAAVAFERAYELSGLPDILYNIGLAHLRWYDVDPDIAHLRKAKVVFQNYVIEIQKNPELGDLEEAETVIAQIDEKIAAAEAAAGDEDDEQLPGSAEPIDYGPDPGKKLRLGGAIAMGAGGLFVVGGVVSGVVLGVRGQEFEEKLATEYNAYSMEGCMAGDARPECDAINDRIETYRSNGRRANALSVALGISLGGLGLIGIVTGAVLFVQGNNKTKRWEERQIVFTPVWQRGGGGLSISGRF
jgi:tetratricopeptide (TPR) repeat protein